MPEAKQQHCAVALSPAVAPGGVDQFIDLTLGQMLSRSKLCIGPPNGRDCPIYCCWRGQLETRFGHVISPWCCCTVRIVGGIRTVTERNQGNNESKMLAVLNQSCAGFDRWRVSSGRAGSGS